VRGSKKKQNWRQSLDDPKVRNVYAFTVSLVGDGYTAGDAWQDVMEGKTLSEIEWSDLDVQIIDTIEEEDV